MRWLTDTLQTLRFVNNLSHHPTLEIMQLTNVSWIINLQVILHTVNFWYGATYREPSDYQFLVVFHIFLLGYHSNLWMHFKIVSLWVSLHTIWLQTPLRLIDNLQSINLWVILHINRFHILWLTDVPWISTFWKSSTPSNFGHWLINILWAMCYFRFGGWCSLMLMHIIWYPNLTSLCHISE